MTVPSSFWNGRRVLVTGCTGLIGSAAVRELLARGADVVGLVRDRVADGDFAREPAFRGVRLVHGRADDRFRVQSALAVHDVQVVFHFARTADDPNADRGTAVLAAVADFNPAVPVVAARPLPTLGLAREIVPTAPPPTMPWGVARFGEVFGGGDRKTFRVVPASVLAHLTGDRATGPVDNAPPRDFVHAPDAARACLLLAESLAAKPTPTAVAFRSGWVFADRDMAAVVRAVMTNGAVPSLPSAAPDKPLGWAPRTGLVDALKETAAWYREFLQSRFFGTRAAAGRKAA